jgi:hypothetical protein
LESIASRSNTSNSKELVPVSTKSNCTRLKVKGAEGSYTTVGDSIATGP